MADNRRDGFTLVELLVVIVIIGILVGLLVPAIQAARESARRTQCLNSLKQIGLSIHMYHESWGQYPAGRTETDQYGASWAFHLLPYMEEQALFDSFHPALRVDDDLNSQAMRTPVHVYFCPSRRSPAADRDFDNSGMIPLVRGAAAGGDYAANGGLWHNYQTPPELGGPSGDLEPGITAGPIYTKSRIKARQVTDGLSNTFAVGERHIPSEELFPGSEIVHFQQGDTAFFTADSVDAILGGTKYGLGTGPLDPIVYKFGSEHPKVTQFVFLDGHTTTVPNDVELDVLQRLSVIADGGEVSEADYDQD